VHTSNIKNNSVQIIKGFTLIEILIVISILAILVSMFASSFGAAGGSAALDTTVVSVISVLNDAKSQAISSRDASNYGVRIFDNKLVSFKNSYGTENKETTVSSLVIISTSTGMGNDIVFSNVSGNTNASGTLTVTVLGDSSKSTTIKIYSTGIIEKN
jgi:prepilin-type N-terminal cleavage/methylation domain-containing protein